MSTGAGPSRIFELMNSYLDYVVIDQIESSISDGNIKNELMSSSV